MSSDFYRAFEDRHRGSRELILGRLEVYLPFVAPLKALHDPFMALDLGCGRGEWLELLQNAALPACGVDLDAGMLQACTERGFSVVHGDAIAHLSAQADASLSVVSGFHVAEHIPFDQLQILVSEALRALKPGGLLILETPNPENVAVGTSNFYLDPTHQRPLPPLLLGFLPEFHGFARVATLRLQESPDIHTRSDIKLADVLHGVSPDYAIVAQKGAEPVVMQAFEEVFAKRHGLDLNALASRFDQRQDELLTAHHETRLMLASQQQQMDAMQGSQHALHTNLHAIQTERDAIQAELDLIRIERDAAQAELDVIRIERDAAQAERDALHNSLSWKVTAPLRITASFAASPVSFMMGKILKNPHLSERINGVLKRFPSLHARLREAAIDQGMMIEAMPVHALNAPLSEAKLSPRARQIYTALAQKISHHRE